MQDQQNILKGVWTVGLQFAAPYRPALCLQSAYASTIAILQRDAMLATVWRWNWIGMAAVADLVGGRKTRGGVWGLGTSGGVGAFVKYNQECFCLPLL